MTAHLAALIPTLQHSIRSLWLRATPAGFPPARLQTISSPHLQRIVTVPLPSSGAGGLVALWGLVIWQPKLGGWHRQ